MPSEIKISAIEERDVPEVCRFLRGTFGVDEEWPVFREEVVRWKALTPHPLWEGGRGFAMWRGGEMMAYGCAVPTRFVREDSEALVACVVDWAANKAMPGGGVMVYQAIGKVADGLIGVGGSDDARRVLPRMGFRVAQELDTYARVTRPMARFRETGGWGWRDFARMGRNILRGMRPVGATSDGWQVRRVERFESVLRPRTGVVSSTICYRDEKILNYLLLCPAARMEGYILEREGRPMGYAVLAFVRGDCRIADAWVDSAEARDWAGAYLALGKCSGAASQVSAGAGTAVMREAARKMGYSLNLCQPVFVKEPGGKLEGDLDAAMGLAVTDAFYL